MLKRFFGKMPSQSRCSECGAVHEGSPSIALRFPTYYFDVPEAERKDRVFVSDDLCHISPAAGDVTSNDIFCIRAILEIPIKGADSPFTWGVWVTQSKDSFEKYVETFSQDQSSLGSFGWLPVDLAVYKVSDPGAPLEHLECDVHWGTKGQRPKVRLWESSHQLSIDQREGISCKRAKNIADFATRALSKSDQLA